MTGGSEIDNMRGSRSVSLSRGSARGMMMAGMVDVLDMFDAR